MSEEIIKEVLSGLITILEFNATRELKNEAVRKQDFKSAVIYREAEVAISKNLPTIERLKEMREKLNSETDVQVSDTTEADSSTDADKQKID